MAIRNLVNTFHQVKLKHKNHKLYITTDVLSSATLDDLKKSLSEIMKKDFSSIKIVFFYGNQVLDPQIKISNLVYLTSLMQNFLEIEFSIEDL